MLGKTLKETIARIPDDAEVVHLWDGGISWRLPSGEIKGYSFHPEKIGE